MTRGRIAGVVALLAVLALVWFARRDREPRSGPGEGAGQAATPADTSQASEDRRVEPPPPPSSGTVVGRVVDADGEPWVGLPVVGGGRETRTGPDGAFELPGLAREELLLDLSSDFDPAEPLGERRLACAVAALAVDLRAAGRVDVGTQVVPRSRPFWIEGHVELEQAWASSEGLTLAEVRLEVRVPEPEELGSLLQAEITPRPGAPLDWSRPPWRADLPLVPPLTADGRLRFAVETPHDPFLLRIQARRFEPFESLIVPTPGGRFAETYRMP